MDKMRIKHVTITHVWDNIYKRNLTWNSNLTTFKHEQNFKHKHDIIKCETTLKRWNVI